VFYRGEEHIFLGREMAQQRDFSEHAPQIIDDEFVVSSTALKKSYGITRGTL